jgi:cell division protein FtsI/penicillin-binding protein 2
MRKEYAWRSIAIAVSFALIGLAIIVQMVRIQVSPDISEFRSLAERNKGWMEVVYPARGEIYDRNGYLLAGNQTVFEIGVTLSQIDNAEYIADTLSRVLDMDYATLLKKMTDVSDAQVYVMLVDFVSSEDAEKIQQIQADIEETQEGPYQPGAASLSGVHFREHLSRSYPEKTIAANVIGFVNQSERGYFGIEEKYNDLLAGNPVEVWVPADPNRVEEIPHVPDGTTLILTIDRELQAATETILDNALDTHGARAGTIIVMDPRNGEVLAMASAPRLDLTNYAEYDSIFDKAIEYNRAVNMPYEPGSVFKILTMAAALDNGTVTPDTAYTDTGVYEIGGAVIHNWDDEAWGVQDMTGCLAHSLNVCLAKIAVQMGTDEFYEYMGRFGIGHPTGIDLSGEAGGRLRVPGDEDWYTIDLATNSFGQGVTATPIQMMMAASSIANEGTMVTPHLLYGMVRDNKQYNFPTQDAGRPIKPETARALNEMLANALQGVDSLAVLPGYRLAGKTGTAEIPTEFGSYSSAATNASFIGWGPVDDPQFMVYVWLEQPTASIWASQTAAPVFAQVADLTTQVLNIPPDIIRLQYAGQ